MTQHHIYDTASEVKLIASDLWSVTNCFGPETFDHFSKLHVNHNETWTRPPDCLEFRLQLVADSPTSNRLKQMSIDMLPEIERIVGYQLVPAESKVWLDLSGWHCPYHVDDPLLFVTYQMFLWSHGEVYGTEFCYGDTPKDFSDPRTFGEFDRVSMPFTPNTGYINLNNNKIHHAKNMTGTRLSACVQYRRKVKA